MNSLFENENLYNDMFSSSINLSNAGALSETLFQENTIQKNDIFSSGLFQAAVLKLYESDRAAA